MREVRGVQRLDQMQPLRGSFVVVIEYVSDSVFDAVRGVADRVAHAGRDRVCEQDRDDSHGCDQQRQPRTPALTLWRGGPRSKWGDRHACYKR